jgi:hypothetical protein
MTDAETMAWLLKRGDGLFPMVWQFNHRPASYTHPSHLPEFAERPKLLEFLRGSRRSNAVLSRALLERFGLDGSWCYDFSSVTRRLGLVDGPTLERLAVYLGAAMHAEEMRRVVSRDELAELREKVGEDVHLFAIKRAELLAGGLVPEVPRSLAGSGDWLERLAVSGLSCFSSLMAAEPSSVGTRFRLKFPAAVPWPASAPLPTVDHEKLSAFARRVLCREVNPDWTPCFN